MKDKNKLYDAVSEIDETWLAESEDSASVKNSFRKARTKKIAAAISLCVCLIVLAGSVSKLNLPEIDINTENKPDVSFTEASDNTATEKETGPITYSSLTVGGHPFEVKQGSGLLDIAAFDESFLNSSKLIIEGEVTDTHTQKYHYITETDGKFENAGGKMKITYEPETIVTTLKIQKVWKGSGSFFVGDTITIEDEKNYIDFVFSYHVGSSYFLYLGEHDNDEMHINYGETEDEKIVEGNNRRISPYFNEYPFLPSIEKTVNGDYIVPEEWKSIALNSDTEVIISPSDIDTDVPDDFTDEFRFRLVKSNDFAKRMSDLLEKINRS